MQPSTDIVDSTASKNDSPYTLVLHAPTASTALLGPPTSSLGYSSTALLGPPSTASLQAPITTSQPLLSNILPPEERISMGKKTNVANITPRKIPRPIEMIIDQDRYNSPIVRQKLKQNPQIYILYKVVTNVLTVLRKRGYSIPDKYNGLEDMTPDQFIISYSNIVDKYNLDHPGSGMTIRKYLSHDYCRGDINNQEIIRVIFPETPDKSGTTTKSQIDVIVGNLGLILNNGRARENIYHAMIVSELALSPQARTSLKKFPAINYELYTYREISFLTSRHFLVPGYRALTNNEIKGMVQKDILISSLKTIAKNDPIVREYGFSVDDVLEITRHNYLYFHPIIVTIEYRVVSRRLMIPK